MRARFVTVQRAVAVDQVNGADASLQFIEELRQTAAEHIAVSVLAGSNDRAHVGVGGVEQNGEVRVADFLVHADDLGGLVEGEPRLELPNQPHAGGLRQFRAFRPEPGDAVERLLILVVRYGTRRGHRIHAQRRAAEVHAHLKIALQQVRIGGFVGVRDRIHFRKIGRVARNAQIVVLEQPDHFAPRRRRRVGFERDMRGETADIDAVVTGRGKMFNGVFERDRISRVRSEGKRPTAQ